MKFYAYLFLFIFLTLCIHPSPRFTFTFSQSIVDDWKQGEAVIFELNHSFSFKKDFRIDTFVFTPNFRYAIGVQYTNLTSQRVNYVVPTDNELFAEGMLKYPAGWIVDPFVSANFRTQLTESFSVSKGVKRATAKLWDPVVSMQSFGFAHSIADSGKRKVLTNRVGVSFKQTRAEIYTQMTDDPRTLERERWKAEAGLEWKAEAVVLVERSVKITSSVEIFASARKISESTFRSTTEMVVSLWKTVGITVRLDLQYDQRQKSGIQYRQSLRAGVNWEL
ncbi:MAG: DUF3078 domain-containing protein [Ignavibacteria bacterium]|nr:DUF3078 domain-containing protein [Ignavibacteria bacterium]